MPYVSRVSSPPRLPGVTAGGRAGACLKERGPGPVQPQGLQGLPAGRGRGRGQACPVSPLPCCSQTLADPQGLERGLFQLTQDSLGSSREPWKGAPAALCSPASSPTPAPQRLPGACTEGCLSFPPSCQRPSPAPTTPCSFPLGCSGTPHLSGRPSPQNQPPPQEGQPQAQRGEMRWGSRPLSGPGPQGCSLQPHGNCLPKCRPLGMPGGCPGTCSSGQHSLRPLATHSRARKGAPDREGR